MGRPSSGNLLKVDVHQGPPSLKSSAISEHVWSCLWQPPASLGQVLSCPLPCQWCPRLPNPAFSPTMLDDCCHPLPSVGAWLWGRSRSGVHLAVFWGRAMWGATVPFLGWHHHDAFGMTFGGDPLPTLIQVSKASQWRSPSLVGCPSGMAC